MSDWYEIEDVIRHRIASKEKSLKHFKNKNMPIYEFLVQWKGYSTKDNTWETCLTKSALISYGNNKGLAFTYYYKNANYVCDIKQIKHIKAAKRPKKQPKLPPQLEVTTQHNQPVPTIAPITPIVSIDNFLSNNKRDDLNQFPKLYRPESPNSMNEVGLYSHHDHTTNSSEVNSHANQSRQLSSILDNEINFIESYVNTQSDDIYGIEPQMQFSAKDFTKKNFVDFKDKISEVLLLKRDYYTYGPGHFQPAARKHKGPLPTNVHLNTIFGGVAPSKPAINYNEYMEDVNNNNMGYPQPLQSTLYPEIVEHVDSIYEFRAQLSDLLHKS